MPNDEYLSVTQWSKKYGNARPATLRLIQDERIPAVKIGNQWAIPAGTEPPPDKRVKSGKYRNWRKTGGKSENE
ncbi:MAG: DNA-binding protein [Clostridiales bacterium]|nr:DNA-binding protein [Clostridiales bacterium]